MKHPKNSDENFIEEEIKVFRGLRILFNRGKKPNVSVWAEKNRVLTSKESSRHGRWSNKTSQYLVGIMDAIGTPCVDTIVLCAGPQSGKTEFAHNFVGFAADHAPGPVLYIMPGERDARKAMVHRITPMFKNSRSLRGHLTGVADDETALSLHLKHMIVRCGWAGSAASLASDPYRYVIFDEVDKYPATSSKKETSPIKLGEARTATYKGRRKKIIISTPTDEGGNIWQYLTTQVQVRFEYYVVCPFCGHKQVMVFGDAGTDFGIKWPNKERDPDKIEALDLAWYECAGCHDPWNDYVRNQAVEAGQWRSVEPDKPMGRTIKEYLKYERPLKIGFHLPGWLSYFVGLSEAAAEFIRGQSDRIILRNFQNKYAALPWLDYIEERKSDKVMDLVGDTPRGVVPSSGVACLVCAADTQDNGFWYTVAAVGYGDPTNIWIIMDGFVETFSALEKVFWEYDYKDVAGNKYVPRMAFIDSGGHRTTEVYDFCRKHRGRIMPTKGASGSPKLPVGSTRIEHFPNGRPMAGGVVLKIIDSQVFKGQLSAKLEVAPGDPGVITLHSETTEDYANQLCSETIDDKGKWVQIGGRANHQWDNLVSIMAIIYFLDVKMWPIPDEQTKSDRPKKVKKVKKQKRARW